MPTPKQLLLTDDRGTTRCWWCGTDPVYQAYHDDEWGFPVADETRLFEKVCLEGFQAGLSWITILRKRENFRRAFRGFDRETLARFNARSVDRLVQDASIVRHRGKIESVLNNAKRARELVDEAGGLAAFFWRFEPPRRFSGLQSTSPASHAISTELKARGWTFVGPTTIYAFMQAMGLVNDHVPGCASRPKAEKARRRFRVPR